MGEKKKKCLTLFINEYRTFVVEVCFSRSDCDEEEAFFLDSWNKFLVFTRRLKFIIFFLNAFERLIKKERKSKKKKRKNTKIYKFQQQAQASNFTRDVVRASSLILQNRGWHLFC